MPADPKTPAEVIAISHRTADEHGILRVLLLACAVAEGNLVWNARRPKDPANDAAYWPDVSGGPWQQTVRYDPAYRGGDAFPGAAEIERVLALQYDVERAARVAALSLRAKWNGKADDESLLRALYLYNWPGGGGKPYSPAHEANYRRGLTEAKAILGAAPMPVRYNRNEPVHPQEDSFDCSQESLEWALYALGRKPQEDWLEPTMIAEGVMSRGQGLLDATGAGLAAFVRRHYGEFGYDANHEPSISWDWIVHEGGNPDGSGHAYPVLIGGRGWNHWTAVRDFDPQRGVLLLANPADGWMGVKQTMTRPTFEALGPFSAVRVWHPDLFAPAPAPDPPKPQPPADTRLARARDKMREALAILDEPAP